MGLWRDYSIEDEALMARNEDEEAREAQARKNSAKLAAAMVVQKRVKSDSNLSINRGNVESKDAHSSSGSAHEVAAVVQDQDQEKLISDGNQTNEGQVNLVSSDENRELLVDDYADDEEYEEELGQNELDSDQEGVFDDDYENGVTRGFKDMALLKMEQLKR